VLDCDPGIGPGLDADDSLAILLTLASPELRLEGVTTTYGNVEVTRATQAALEVLAAAGRSDVPVARGMSLPLSGVQHERSIAEYAKHEREIGPVDPAAARAGVVDAHAVDFIIATALAHPGELKVMAVGPLTNLALALLKEPRLREELAGITIMGGAFGYEPHFGRGNITPVAEYNVWHDPLAARVVMESGVPLTAVGLDVTNPNAGTVLYEEQLREIVEVDSELARFLEGVCRTYIERPRFNWSDRKGCILYDPLAVAATFDPSLVTTEHVPVIVETSGDHTAGQTIPVRQLDRAEAGREAQGGVDVCVDVDGERFVGEFVSRMRGLMERAGS
jgi:inosine-uridine nucleoside N-ribohydrolase